MTLINQIKDLIIRVENGEMTAENARNFTGEEGKLITINGVPHDNILVITNFLLSLC